jgi:phage shock protein PspC (stress-responsive transcriptional regulator)
MNKTININLAGLFFHIDEDAYQRLQRYLAAVRKSFTGTNGAEEIMSDIESRIAELFLEKRSNESQVISLTHVEKVIDIMGQPEDYEVDEELFEEQPPRSRAYAGNPQGKQLYRDTLNGYVGGVSSGLSHFLGIDAIWVRAIWIVLLLFSVGWIALVYVLLWVLVPDAVSTNQRLTMMGKEVNISNIEENFKSGFEPVTDGPTDASYNIVGQKGKRGTVRFFSSLGNLFMGILNVFVRVIGLFLFLIGSISFIALLIGFVTAGAVEVENHNLSDLIELGTPIDVSPWWIGLCLLFFFGIPLISLSIAGLRLLVRNLGSIGLTAKILMFSLWIASIIGGSIIAAKVISSQAQEGKIAASQKFAVAKDKTYNLVMSEDTYDYNDNIHINGNRFSINDYDGITETRLHDINTAITSTTDQTASVTLYYRARGSSVKQAKQNATYIEYTYKITDSVLNLDDYFKIAENGRMNRQHVDVLVALPEGTTFKVNSGFAERYRPWISNNAFDLIGQDDSTYKIVDGDLVCLDCPIIEEVSVENGNGTVPLENDAPQTDSISNTTSTRGQWRYDGNDGVRTRNNQ